MISDKTKKNNFLKKIFPPKKKKRKIGAGLLWLGVGILFVLAVYSAFYTSKTTGVPFFTPAPPDKYIYLGAWVGGFWDDKTKTLHPEKLTSFQNNIDKKMAISHVFWGWDYLTEPKSIDYLNAMSANGWTPMVSANPYFTKLCAESEFNLYKAIALGSCDQQIKQIFTNLKKFDHPMFFRFAWEANITDIGWGIQKVHSTPHEFVDAWRRVHDISREVGTPNLIWVFAVNTNKADSIKYAEMYPGEEYTDWVGIDGYNWGTTQSWSKWQSFDSVFYDSYRDLIEASPGKPVMISEMNSDHTGGDKIKWMHDALAVKIPSSKYSEVKAIVFFDEDKTELENVDWRLENTPEIFASVGRDLDKAEYLSEFTNTITPAGTVNY